MAPNPKALATALNAWLDEHDGALRGDAKLLTQKEWKARGEPYGNTADLTLIIDGSPLYEALNYGSYGWGTLEKLIALAARFGYYHELGYAWSVHFYPA